VTGIAVRNPLLFATPFYCRPLDAEPTPGGGARSSEMSFQDSALSYSASGVLT